MLYYITQDTKPLFVVVNVPPESRPKSSKKRLQIAHVGNKAPVREGATKVQAQTETKKPSQVKKALFSKNKSETQISFFFVCFFGIDSKMHIYIVYNGAINWFNNTICDIHVGKKAPVCGECATKASPTQTAHTSQVKETTVYIAYREKPMFMDVSPKSKPKPGPLKRD